MISYQRRLKVNKNNLISYCTLSGDIRIGRPTEKEVCLICSYAITCARKHIVLRKRPQLTCYQNLNAEK